MLNKAIDFVLSQQKQDGLLASGHYNMQMYEHGISSTMLAQAFNIVDDARKARIEKALTRSTQLILDAQRTRHGQPKTMPHTGGWRYSKTSEDSDLSVTSWQLMALHGCSRLRYEGARRSP